MKKNKTLTAVEWLIKVIDEQQKSYIDLAKKDKSLKKGVDAILTATTLLKMKCNQAKEMEKQQIIDAFLDDFIPSKENIKEAEQYYNETFNKQLNVVEFTKPISDIYDEALQSFKRYQELMYSKTNQCNNETFNSEENENN